MNRPLSDADTTFMPEMHPATVPMAVAELANACGWCGIRLSAVPERPREFDGMRFHPGGCISAARGLYRGEETETSGMMKAAEGAA